MNSLTLDTRSAGENEGCDKVDSLEHVSTAEVGIEEWECELAEMTRGEAEVEHGVVVA